MQDQQRPAQMVHVSPPRFLELTSPDFYQIDEYPTSLIPSGNSSIFCAHYSNTGMPFPEPVQKLTFNHLGSFEIPANIKEYAHTCQVLIFKGKIHSPRIVFEIAHQLPNVSVVEISIGAAQAAYMEEPSQHFFKTPYCPQVKFLKITMDDDYFYGRLQRQRDNVVQGYIQNTLVLFVEALLKHAADSFPNLLDSFLKLPSNPRLHSAVQSLYQACPYLGKAKAGKPPPQNEFQKEKVVILPYEINGKPFMPTGEYFSWSTNLSPPPVTSPALTNQPQPFQFDNALSSNTAFDKGNGRSEQGEALSFSGVGSMVMMAPKLVIHGNNAQSRNPFAYN